MISWLIGNTLVAAAAAVLVATIARFNQKRPELNHSLWLLVFVLLVAPPLPLDSHPGHVMRSSISSWLAPTASTPAVDRYPEVRVDWPVASGVASVSSASAPEDLAVTLETLDGELAALSSSRSRLPVTPGVLGLALVALAALLCGLIFGRRISRFHRRILSSPRAALAHPELDAMVRRVAARLAMPAPEIRLVTGIGSPAVWCLGKARLLWPRGMDGETADAVAPIEPSVIAHELAHIARRDTWIARLEPLATLLLFWHPLYWLIRSQVHHFAELSCDAWALWAYPADRRVYAEALLGASEQNRHAPIPVRGLCATHPDTKDLERRLTLIMRDQVSRGASRAALFSAALGVLLVAPGLSQGGAEEHGRVEVRAPQVAVEIDVQDGSYLERASRAKELIGKAEELFQAGNWPESVDVFEAALSFDPDNAFAHTRLGYMQIGLGMLEEAREHLERQAELGAEVPIALYNLACVSSRMGDKTRAIDELAAAIRAGFDDPELIKGDGDLEGIRSTRQFEAAVKLAAILRDQRAGLESGELERLGALKTIAKIASDDGEIFAELGMALHEAGDFKGSLKCWTRQAQLGHEAPMATYNQGCARALLGDRAGAIEALMKSAEMGFSYPAVTEDPDLKSLAGAPGFDEAVKALSYRKNFTDEVYSALDSGAYEQALEQLAVLTDNTDVDAEARGWANLTSAEAYVELGDLEAAVRHYESALAEGYSKEEVLTGLTESLAKLGQLDRAEEEAAYAKRLVKLEQASAQKELESARAQEAKVRVKLERKELANAEKLKAVEQQHEKLRATERELEAKLAELDAKRAELEAMIRELRESKLQ